MMLSRTRKQMKYIESFYKEAGLDGEIENIYQKNNEHEPLAKKDRLLTKKKNKAGTTAKTEDKTTVANLHSDASQQLHKPDAPLPELAKLSTRQTEESTLPLSKIISKISILHLEEPRTLHGCYGHSTVVFNKPIPEGKFYLEFRILKPNLDALKAKIKSPPSMRVGICPATYPKNSPLGQGTSIGYKSYNGRLVYGSQQSEPAEPAHQDDVIGLKVSFSAPYKYPNKQQLRQNSYIEITKNGKSIQKCQQIYHLYNYAAVQVRHDRASMQYCPEDFVPYARLLCCQGDNEPTEVSAGGAGGAVPGI